MANDEKGPDIRMSGWLPGVELNGLGTIKDRLWEHFEEAWRTGDITREGLRVPIVAVLEVQTVKVPVPGSEDQPTVNVKMLMVEPVVDDAEQKQTVAQLTELRARRRGDEPTLFDAVDGATVVKPPDVNDPLTFPDVDAYLDALGPFSTEDAEAEARDRYKAAITAAITDEKPATGGETTTGRVRGNGRKRSGDGKVLTAHFSAT